MVLKKVSVIATLPGDVAVGNPKTLNVQSYVKSYVKSTFNMKYGLFCLLRSMCPARRNPEVPPNESVVIEHNGQMLSASSIPIMTFVSLWLMQNVD